MWAPPPSVNMATTTAISNAISGVPMMSSTLFGAPLGRKMSANALASMSTTGSSTVASVTPNDGRVRWAVNSLRWIAVAVAVPVSVSVLGAVPDARASVSNR